MRKILVKLEVLLNFFKKGGYILPNLKRAKRYHDTDFEKKKERKIKQI